MRDTTFTEALAKAEHLKALGDTRVFLRDEASDLPWSQVTSVETGSLHRMSGPASAWVIAHIDGIDFQWSVDFEHRDANGRGVSMFDESRLREVMMRLPAEACQQFARMLSDSVLPELMKHTASVREALHRQWSSEDCVRGLIAFADKPVEQVVAA